MTDWKKITTETYDKNAKAFAEYFNGIGARTSDINRAFKLAGNPVNAKIIEIGCADGRDAEQIIQKTNNYTAFDISKKFIALARKHLPNENFEVADALVYRYGKDLDIVFAFASLLHLDKEDIATVLAKVHRALKPGGIFYMSLKLVPKYRQEIKRGEYGDRMFYFYNPRDIENLASKDFEVVYVHEGVLAGTDWFEIALKNT